VRERGGHCPGRVGEEFAGREVRQGLVFEVADRELHDRVLAMLCFDDLDRVGPVGQERLVAPVGPELGLGSQESGAAHDQPLGAEHRLRDLRLPSLRVILEGLPVLLGDRGDCGPDVLLLASADRIRPSGALQTAHDLVVPESRVCAQQLRPGRPALATRGISSSTRRSAPREVFAEPFRARMCSTSPVPARVARIG
jgi:hypothetical protein